MDAGFKKLVVPKLYTINIQATQTCKTEDFSTKGDIS